MPKVSAMQNNFNSGQLSKRLFGRTDINQYRNGAEEITNFLLSPQGGLRRRSGLVFAGGVQDDTKTVAIIPFEFSTIDQYMLVLNNGKIEFFRDQGRVLETAVNISGATQADPVVITATAHNFSDGDRVFIQSVGGMTDLNNRLFKVANKTTNTFEITDNDGVNIDGTGFAAYTSGGTVSHVYSISHPWTDAELPDLQWAQNADTMYVVHKDEEPRKIVRTGHTSWTLSQPDFEFGPFKPVNTDSSHTMNPSATTGNITITSSTAFFTSDMVGGLIKVGGTTGSPARQGYAKITGFTSTTVVDATVQHTLSLSTATDDWAIGAWSDDAGFPRAVVWFEQRLFFAGSSDEPQTIWGSVTEEFENFESGADDDDALVFTIASNKVNVIQWLAARDEILLGTSGGPFAMSSGSDATPLTPSGVTVKKKTNYGSHAIKPVEIGSFIYFVQRDKQTLRELQFDLVDGFNAINMSILSPEVTDDNILAMDYQQSPDNILWSITGDGKAPTFTREIPNEVLGWSVQETDGTFEDVGIIPQSTYDEVWFVVKRTINGVTRRYIEYLSAPEFSTQADAFFVDSGLTYDGAATTTIKNLQHLEGEEVSILADGAVHPNKTVANGQITLDRTAEKVHVGLSYTSTLKTLNLEAGSAIGTSQGMTKRINKVLIRVWDSLGMKAGSPTTQDIVVFRSGSDPMDSAPPLFTGDKEIQYPGGYDKDAQVVVTQDQPLPLNITALMIQMTEFDR